MKLQTTNKQIKANFYKIIEIGYCDAQYLLAYKKPFAYTCGVYGWNADFYEIGNTCISTGYRPIGERVDYELLRQLEREAQVIFLEYTLSNETREKMIDDLLNKLIDSIICK